MFNLILLHDCRENPFFALIAILKILKVRKCTIFNYVSPLLLAYVVILHPESKLGRSQKVNFVTS